MPINFNVEESIGIFDSLFAKRPEISPESLKQDLKNYYLPYVEKLIKLKDQKNSPDGILVGVSAIQGAGKTTQGEILELLLKHLGFSSISRSIDDHYVTHAQLCELRQVDPRFVRRGVTHDVPVAMDELSALQTMEDGQPVLIAGYHKGAHYGDGDRFRWVQPEEGMEIVARVSEEEIVAEKKLQIIPVLDMQSLKWNGQEIDLPENMGAVIPLAEHSLSEGLITYLRDQIDMDLIIKLEGGKIIFSGSQDFTVEKSELPTGWVLVTKKPDFIFYDGWMLGARSVWDNGVFDASLPALETPEARTFAADVNKKLEEYYPLWDMFDFLSVLYLENYQMSLKWRDQAEDALRAKGQGMTSEQIREFVYYFWRSVHPAIHIKNLTVDTTHTSQVVKIGDDHSIKEVLTPDQLL